MKPDPRDSVEVEEQLALLAALEGESCFLDHSGDPRGAAGEHMQATDWLMIPFPDGTTMSIPVCELCAKSLQGYEDTGESEWYLLICLECKKTKWLHRKFSIADYPEMIHLIRDCPHCRDFEDTAQMEDIWDN